MSVETDLLARAGLARPDGRPLFAWGCSNDEHARLATDLALRLAHLAQHPLTAARFVLWAAEEIRAQHEPGHLTWEWLFGRLGRVSDGALGRYLTERGLDWWGKPVRLSEGGNRMFLYSLMAEGGFPDAYLAEAARYRGTVLAMLSEIEAEGALGHAAAERVARRRIADLPQAFRHEDSALLLANLALALAQARARLPAELPPEAAEAWLDRQVPDWREALPLPLSDQALEALIRPALRATRGEAARRHGPLCRRELRCRADGGGWAAYAVVGDGALLEARFLDGVDPSLRLRLLPLADDGGPVPRFLGVPEPNGWRLARIGGGAEVVVRLSPDRPLVLAAHADGRPLGEAVVDAGLPLPEVAPSFWRALDPGEEPPTRIEPLTGPARTRTAWLWLLAGAEADPVPGNGVTIGQPEPAPGGRLWPITGCGTIAVAGQALQVATSAESEAPAHRLHILGRVLPGWRTEDGQIPFVGEPAFWGAEGDGKLYRLRDRISTRAIPRRLCGYLAEWQAEGEVVVRTPLIALPEEARIGLAETAPGAVQLDAGGLVAGWHMRLTAESVVATAQVTDSGSTQLTMEVAGQVPAALRLRLSDPATGAALVLVAPWPARHGMIVRPDGTRLARDQTLAVGALSGWRSVVPNGLTGALQLSSEASGVRLGIPVNGEVRLAVAEPLIRAMLALGGPDVQVQLRLIVAGDEGKRLTLRRYENGADVADGVFVGGAAVWRLHAVALDPPDVDEVHTRDDVRGHFNLAAWLGDTPALWLVQARSETGSVVRPMVWSAALRPASTRAARVAGYAEEWHRLLDRPRSPAWDRLWRLIRAAREGGDAAALDQVQALGEAQGAAVALLFRVAEAELVEVLALEDATRLWWPITRISAWVEGVATDLARRRASLLEAGLDAIEVENMSGEAMARRAGMILAIRPEILGHLGAAFARNNRPPVAHGAHFAGGSKPLGIPHAREHLMKLAQEAARRETPLPEGTAGLRPARHSLAAELPDHLRALLDAPMVAAEIVAETAPRPDLQTLFQLVALRHADPIWFDAALPAAIQLAVPEILS